MAAQPTASLLLFTILAILTASLFGWRSGVSGFSERMIVRLSMLTLPVTATANLIYQVQTHP